jgi:hypothetical protein
MTFVLAGGLFPANRFHPFGRNLCGCKEKVHP